MYHFLIFARVRNEAANNWLKEHPMALGGIAILLGLVIGGWGIAELMSGVARDKYGNAVEGGMGKTLAIIRIVAGAGCLIFGLYKMVAG